MLGSSLCPLSWSVCSQPGQSWHPPGRGPQPSLVILANDSRWGLGAGGEHQAGCVNSKPITSPSLRSLHTRDKWFIEVAVAAGRPQQQGRWGDFIIQESNTRLSGGGPAGLPPPRSLLSPRLWAKTERVRLRYAGARGPPSPPRGSRRARGAAGGTEPSLGSWWAGEGGKPSPQGAPCTFWLLMPVPSSARRARVSPP